LVAATSAAANQLPHNTMPDSAQLSPNVPAAINQAALAITSELSLDKTLQHIVNVARQLVQAQYAALGIPNAAGEMAQFVTSGMSAAEIAAIDHHPRGRGLLGYLLAEGRPMRLNAITDHPSSIGFPPGHPPMSSFLGAPIRSGSGELLGSLYLTDKIGSPHFTDEDEALIALFAAHAGLAVSNARLYQSSLERGRELEIRNLELSTLNGVARVISRAQDRNEMLAGTLEQAMTAFQMESGELFLLEDNSGALTQRLYRGSDPEAFQSVRQFKLGHGFVGRVAETGLAISLNLSNNNQANQQYQRQAVFEAGYVSLLYGPLTVKNEVVGVIGLASRQPRQFTARELTLLEGIGNQMGVAVENARLYSRVGELAIIEERSRIGMDLHDGVIQSIYAVGLTLESTRLLLADNSSEAGQLLSHAINGLNDVIRDIRNFILDLRPHRFEGDLGKGILRLVREFQANAMVLVNLHAPSDFINSLPPAVARTIFMTTQEALANVARHARATHVSLEVRQRFNELGDALAVLTIADDGRGFNVEDQAQMVGHGLANMRIRAENLNGQFQLESTIGEGTTIRLSLPI
jgi:two-component system, NarL family, sensor histidine kinase DevS